MTSPNSSKPHNGFAPLARSPSPTHGSRTVCAPSSSLKSARTQGSRRWWRLGSTHVAWGGAILGAALIGATALTFLSSHPQDKTITGISAITADHAVDPNNVIQVSFNQPMNKTAVESGVRIQPATEVSYSWTGNNLVITPVHHLTGNTGYTVTIAQSAIRALTGAVAATPINITFATRPTPPVAQSTTPTLALATVGPQGDGVDGNGGSLLFAPDGSLVSTAGLLPTSLGTPPATAATPTASPAATPEGAAGNGPSVAGQLVDYPASGKPFALAATASAAAFSPNGTYVAAAVDDGNGGSKIVVTLGDGSQQAPTKLIDSSTPVTALDMGLQRPHRLHRRHDHQRGRLLAARPRHSSRSRARVARSRRSIRAARMHISPRRVAPAATSSISRRTPRLSCRAPTPTSDSAATAARWCGPTSPAARRVSGLNP